MDFCNCHSIGRVGAADDYAFIIPEVVLKGSHQIVEQLLLHGVRLRTTSLQRVDALKTHLLRDADGRIEIEPLGVPLHMADGFGERVKSAQSGFCLLFIPEVSNVWVCIDARSANEF